MTGIWVFNWMTKNSTCFKKCLEVEKLPSQIDLKRSLRDTTIKMKAMELSSLTICYLITLEAFSQRTVLRIMSMPCMFLELIRKGSDIFCPT